MSIEKKYFFYLTIMNYSSIYKIYLINYKEQQMTKLYFAYGSNLNFEQMSMRCPNAVSLGPLYIPSWKLVFRGVADIEQSDNNDDLLPVGVWRITEQCEQSLDIYEGVNPNSNNDGLYKKIEVCGMMTYKMNSDGYSPPSSYYFNGILDGYQNFGLNSSHLYDALGWSYYNKLSKAERLGYGRYSDYVKEIV